MEMEPNLSRLHKNNNKNNKISKEGPDLDDKIVERTDFNSRQSRSRVSCIPAIPLTLLSRPVMAALSSAIGSFSAMSSVQRVPFSSVSGMSANRPSSRCNRLIQSCFLTCQGWLSCLSRMISNVFRLITFLAVLPPPLVSSPWPWIMMRRMLRQARKRP